MTESVALFGGDAARLLGTPSLRGIADADSVADIVRAAARDAEAGRWIVVGGFDASVADPGADPAARAAFDAALDLAAPRHPVCLWAPDLLSATVNALAAADRAVGARRLVGADVRRVRSVLPKWTLETWKDRLELLARDLATRGVRRIVDLDEDAAEGWRALDDEGLLKLDRVDVVCAERNLRRALRDGARSDGRVLRTGVLFDFDLENLSRERRVEDLAMTRDAGLKARLLARSAEAFAEAERCLRLAGPHAPGAVELLRAALP